MKRDTNTSLASWLQNPDKTNVNDKNIPYVLSKLNMLMKVYNQKKRKKESIQPVYPFALNT